MGHSLEMHCPKCGTIRSLSVIKTDPVPIYDNILAEYIGAKDFCYRERRRVCGHCSQNLQTIEMSKEAFYDMTMLINNYSSALQNYYYNLPFQHQIYKNFIVSICLKGINLLERVFESAKSPQTNMTIIIRKYSLKTLTDFIDDLKAAVMTLSAREQYFLGFCFTVGDTLGSDGEITPLNQSEIEKMYRKMRHPSRSRVLRLWYNRFCGDDEYFD